MGQAGGLQPQPVLQLSVPRIRVVLAIQTPFVASVDGRAAAAAVRPCVRAGIRHASYPGRGIRGTRSRVGSRPERAKQRSHVLRIGGEVEPAEHEQPLGSVGCDGVDLEE